MELCRLTPAGRGLLGLARRARAVVLGTDALRQRVERGQPLLILADPGLAERTLRELDRWQEMDPRTRVVGLADMADLNDLLGTKGVRALGLADGGFRRGLEGHLSPLNTGDQGGCQEA